MIKIASMVGTPDLEAPTLAPYSGNLREAFSKVAELGYDGVEFMTKNPALLNGLEIRRLLDEFRLKLSQICTGHVWGEDKLGLVNSRADLSREGMARMKEIVDFTAAYFEPGIPVNIGRSRGPGDPAQPEKSLAAYETAFRELADYALPKKVRLTLEPITATVAKFILTTQDGIEMCRRVNRPNFGLMLDVYHMNIEDVDIYQSYSGCQRILLACPRLRQQPQMAGKRPFRLRKDHRHPERDRLRRLRRHGDAPLARPGHVGEGGHRAPAPIH